ncbi:hypothetical protein [Sinorhizobium meliloti]|uniref:hypothetical protein n=1 Tax=Rhizobium meliloti TaxID=382 RepID=UPI000FDB9D09|nr:hypothetical protein [Sinorhizobium meliloti]RVH00096.1 hypothetical protein CN210_28650 [Sinorhizobium meliloti]
MAWSVDRALFRAFLVIMLVVSASNAGSQEQTEPFDRCGAILAEALLTKSIEQGASSKAEAQRYFLCSANENGFRNFVQRANSESGGGSGGIEIPGFSISGGGEGATAGNATDSQIRQWKSQNCTERNSEINQSASAYSYYQYLSREQIEAWKSCVINSNAKKLTQLKCLANPSSDEIEFEAHWRSDEGSTPRIDEMFVSRSGEREPIPNDGEILLGLNIFLVERRPNTDHRFILKARNGASAVSCNILIPREPERPLSATDLSAATGKWCTSRPNRSFAHGLREVELWDSGDRLAVKTQYSYVPPGHPRDGYPDPSAEPQTEYLTFKTVKPGLVARMEWAGTRDNGHRYEGSIVILVPTDGYYLWPLWIMRKQGSNLQIWRGLVKGESQDHQPDVEYSTIEQIMQAEPIVYRPC